MPLSQLKRFRRFPPWTVGLLALALVFGIGGGFIADAINDTSPSSCPVTSVASENLPSVVTITAGSGGSAGTGSGEVIRSNGYVLTNNHVIASAAGGLPLNVVFNDGRSTSATITGRDPLTDLAVIKVGGATGLRTIPIGDSASVQVGQPVIALGAPLGLSSTVTTGIVSALGRTVTLPGQGPTPALLVDALQTDAAINPGNSGGALVDCSGRLVGVPTAGASVPGESGGGSIGLGFAIPANLATTVSDELIATGRASYSFLGLQATPLAASATHGGGARGLLVTAVVPRGPADTAGLRAGDVITSIAGRPAASVDQLVGVTLTQRAGDRVEVGYQREGRAATATVVLGTQP